MQDRFQYKAWANAELLEAMSRIDAERHADNHRRAIRLLNHAYVVDRIFAAHLTGAEHRYRDTNTPETPPLDLLRAQVAASDAWYVDYAAGLSADELAVRIPFAFTDGERGAMRREEMLFHVLVHGAYHRGNIGTILSACGIEAPGDTYTRFLHASDPARRQPAWLAPRSHTSATQGHLRPS